MGCQSPLRRFLSGDLALSVLAGIGLHRLTHGARRAAPWLAATALLVLAEAGVAPLPLNAGEPPGRYEVPNAELYPDGRLPDVYEAVAAAPADAVVLE